MRVIYIGLCFMILFTAHNSAQNLMTQIFKQLGHHSLGQSCLSFRLFCFALTTIVAPYFFKKITAKTGLILGSTTYIIFFSGGALVTACAKYNSDAIICNVSFSYTFNIITAGLSGIGACFLWLAQATYVNACADEQSRGVFNGVFLSLFETSQIFSGMIATFLLGNSDANTFYLTLVVIAGIAIAMFIFIQAPVQYSTEIVQNKSQGTLAETLRDFVQIIRDKRYYFLFMVIIFTGVATAFYFVFMGTAVTIILSNESLNVINQSTGFIFIVLSLGEISAGITIGRLADKYDKIKILSISMYIYESALVMTLLACLFGSYQLAIISGLLWGYGETALGTMINVIIGSKFNSNPKIFSVYRFFYCLGGVLTTFCGVALQNDSPFLFALVIATVLLICQTMTYKYLKEENSQKSSDYVKFVDEKQIMIEMKKLEKA